MGQAYTPGLTVSESCKVERERRLPLKGEVTVRKGDRVECTAIVARTFLPGNVDLVNVANRLGIEPKELKAKMLKKEGETVKKDEAIAQTAGLFGLFKGSCTSPAEGTIESISDVTGQVIIRQHPIPVQMNAYIDGVVEEILPEEGVIVGATGTYIQGIFGVGGETFGTLKVLADHPGDTLQVSKITPDCRDSVLVVGSVVTQAMVAAALKAGVRGIIAGGIDDQDLKEFLGYDLGVAITGSEEKGITLLVTEGFGAIPMAERTFSLLKSREGMRVSVNGATQIRAGVIRPEIVIPLTEKSQVSGAPSPGQSERGGLHVGSQIRIIRQPYFGKLATVKALPVELRKLETEAHVRVAEVAIDDGKTILLPRANLELIER